MAHIIVLDSNQDIFVCGPCKSVFNSLEVFLNHKKIKCGHEVSVPESMLDNNVISQLPTTIACNPVLATLDENNVTTNTQGQENLELNFSCKICGKMMKTKKGLSAHTKSHYVKSYQCLVCGRCFIQKSHLQRHIPSHKVWPESLSDTTAKSSNIELLGYSCTYCKDIFSNYNQFRAHLKVHQDVKVFKCIQGDCPYLFDNLENLLKHVSSAHDEPLYSCYICMESFDSLKNIYTHQQQHTDYVKNITPSKQYKCLQCDAVYNKAEKLSLHMQTETHKKKCIHCGMTFASNKRLRLHLQVHRKVKPFQCHICNSSFHMKKYLTTHMLRHAKRNFTCTICKSMFKRQDLLQRHLRLHQVNKLFKCPYKDVLNCKKEFHRRDKLKLHIKIHSKHVTGCKTNQLNIEAMKNIENEG